MAKNPFSYFQADAKTRLRYGVFDPPDGKFTASLLVFGGVRDNAGKFLENIAEWNKKGYRVTVLEPRGQGGSTRELADGNKTHVRDFADYVSDAQKFITTVWAPQNKDVPRVFLGQSLGGHVGMRLMLENPDLQKKFDKTIFSAPMVNLRAEGIIAAAVAHGGNEDYAITQRTKDLAKHHRRNAGKDDPARAEAWRKYNEDHPDEKSGGFTKGFVRAALDSIDHVQGLVRAGARLDTAKTSFILPTRDKRIPPASQYAMTQALGMPEERIRIIEGAPHGPFHSRDKFRDQAMGWVDSEIKSIKPGASDPAHKRQHRGERERVLTPPPA